MAWIESHQKLKDDPKMLNLCFAMGWTVDETIGKLHRFWWWCVDHAEDGNISRFTPSHIAHAMCVDTKNGELLVRAMIECGKPDVGFLEEKPYLRVVNWWKYMRRFLHSKYGKNSPERLDFIENLYRSGSHTPKRSGKQSNLPIVPTDLPTYHKDARSVLHVLNEGSGKKFREADGNLAIISQRLNEDGVTFEGVRLMVNRQCKLWLGTEMAEYLRPETLFRKSKFDGYYAAREMEVTKGKGKNGSGGKPNYDKGF